MAEEHITAIAEQGRAALESILPQLVIATAGAETHGQQVALNGADAQKKRATVVIDDVRAWKASLPISQGAVPVRDLGEFEGLEAKL